MLCGGWGQVDALKRYGAHTDSPTVFNDALIADVKKVLQGVETDRLNKVENSALFNKRVSYRAPLDRLTPVERRAAELFVSKVKPLIQRIEARQQDPNIDGHRQWLAHYGDYYSKVIFQRIQRDTCAGLAGFDPTCSLFPYFPDQPAINGMIDPTIAMEEFQRLGKTLSADAEALRPTTVLKKNSDGKIETVPLPLHPAYRKDHLALAAALEEIARLRVNGQVLDPMLQTQLRAWARFFRSGKARDEAVAAQATIDGGDGGGSLRVHIGPSESYWPDNTKFPYALMVGVRDQELRDRLKAGATTFAQLEASLTNIPHYQPRALSVRGGFADPVYQIVIAGFLETFPVADPIGYNFPNYSGYKAVGGNRFIVLERAQYITHDDFQSYYALTGEPISDWDPQRAAIDFTVRHESGHLLGVQRDHVTPSGKRMGASFGRHWGSADEPKADLVGVLDAQMHRSDGPEGERNFQAALRYFAAKLLGAGYKGKRPFHAEKLDDIPLTDHVFGITMTTAYFFRTGVFRFDEASKKIRIDYAAMPNASGDLLRKIIAFQAAGDLAGYLQFAVDCAKSVPDEADRMILEANKNRKFLFIERHL